MIVPQRSNRETLFTRRQALVAGAALAGLALWPQPRRADAKTRSRRAADDIWLVSTRHLGCPNACVLDAPLCLDQCIDGQWQRRSSEEFFGTVNQYERTIFFIHGNRADAQNAVEEGLAAHAALLGWCGEEQPPVRFVIWSWPADQLRRPLKDVRVKAARADGERYYLAPFLAEFPNLYPIGLVGYSYGARVASGALHVIGGGTSAKSLATGPQFHTALWAAAFNNDWLLAGMPLSCAGLACHDWLITCNPCDPLLKYFHAVDKGEALGYTGLANGPVPGSPHITQLNVANCVGATHDLDQYLMCTDVLEHTREVVLAREV